MIDRSQTFYILETSTRVHNGHQFQVARQSESMTHSHAHPAVLKCTSTAEFLATLPLLLGYQPENSIVLVLFQDRQARCAVRIDLPCSSVPFEQTGLEGTVSELLNEFSWVTGVAVVIVTDEEFGEHGHAPHSFLALWLERVIEMHGTPIIELCCVAADAWGSYRGGEGLEFRRPLHEIERTTRRHQRHLGDSDPVPSLTVLAQLPHADPQLRTELENVITRTPLLDIGDMPLSTFEGALAQCAVAIDEGLSGDTLQECATLLRCANTVPTWLIPALLIAAGTESPFPPLSEDVSSAFLQLLQNPRHTPPQGGEPIVQRLTMFSSERLPSSRITQMRNTLAHLTAHAPPHLQTGPLCLTAWLWWMSGLSSAASQLSAQAIQLAPEHAVVTTVQSLIHQGPPLWVFQMR